MPPHLYHGVPRQQRRICVPAPQFFCSCSECGVHNYYEVQTNKIKHGQYLTEAQYKIHCRRERQRMVAADNYQAFGDPETAQLAAPDLPAGRSANIPQTMGGEMDSKDWDFKSAGEDDHGSEDAHSGRTKPRKVRRRRVSVQSSEALISHQLHQLGDSLSIITTDSFRQGFHRNPAVFSCSPSSQAEEPNFDLDAYAPSNYAFLQYEKSLQEASAFLSCAAGLKLSRIDSHRRKRLDTRVADEQHQALLLKKGLWEQQAGINQRTEPVIDAAAYTSVQLRGLEPLSCLVYLLSAALHLLSNVSFADLGFILPCLAMMLRLSLSNSTYLEKVSVSVPKDVRSALRPLGLDPVVDAVVCCPKCFATYAWEPSDPSQSCPEFCEYQDTPNSQSCGRRLRTKAASQPSLPTRLFFYQDLHHWIARMYSRPDIEHYLDKSPIQSKPGQMEDIWDGSILQDFLGPDGLPFMQKHPDEGRLVFGLNMDGFHPHGSREAGKKTTICGIYLVCFNLPPEIRFKMENIFLLGVVPGPQEPSTHEVNHILRPLVNDLLILWNTGIFLSRTCRHPLGRLIRGALIPVICDLPAARRVAGLGGHASGHFCSECLQKLEDINDLSRENWTSRSYTDHIFHAEKWKNAETGAERIRVFRKYGAKWSELLRLQYWDPTRFVVIDSMHGFYLRLFLRHVRDVWGMDIKLDDGDGFPDLNISEQDLEQARRILQCGQQKQLETLPRDRLQCLCRELGLHYGGRKRALIKLLLAYRMNAGWAASDSDESAPLQHTNVDTAAEGNQASNSIQTPSSVPNLLVNSIRELDPNPILPSVTTPLASASPARLESKELEILYCGGKTFINQAKKDILVQLYSYLTGSEVDECSRLTRDHLKELIFALRASDTIQSGNARVTKSSGNAMAVDPSTLACLPVPPATQEHIPIDTPFLLTTYESGTKTALNKLRKHLLVVLCTVKFGRSQDFGSLKKEQLLDQLHEARLADGIVDEDGGLIDQVSPKKTNVLGKDNVKEIRHDMGKLKLPTWFKTAPKHPGEIRWGKFKAHEWKAFCNVNLPITLTRLWGGKQKDDRQYQMLENFLHLVTAVKHADQRKLTDDTIQLYDSHISAYLKGFIQLYPFANISPYQHLSLHFASQLHRWGPTHSWRCFAFERYNGILQGLPTSNKFGELEKSKFLRFCRAQNLRHLFTQAQLPPEIHPVIDLFEKRYKVPIHGTLLDNIMDNPEAHKQAKHAFDEKYIDCAQRWFSLNVPDCNFHSHQAYVIPHLDRHGRRYQGGEHPNKNIMFRPDKSAGQLLMAGQIKFLFSYLSQTFAVLHAFKPIPVNHRFDFTYNLPQAAGYLVSVELEPDPIVIQFEDIVSHFASISVDITEVQQPLLHVLPL